MTEAPTNIPDLLRKARQTSAINSHMLDVLTAVDARLAMLARKHGGDVRDAAVALRGLIAKAMDEDPETLGERRDVKPRNRRKDDYMRGYGDGFKDGLVAEKSTQTLDSQKHPPVKRLELWQVPARELDNTELEQQYKFAADKFDRRGEHGGSPGEFWAERMDEIDQERKRRA